MCSSDLDLLNNARKKLESKNADMIVANSLNEKGAGFGVDTNRVTILTTDKEETLDLMKKEDLAYELLQRCNTLLKVKKGE